MSATFTPPYLSESENGVRVRVHAQPSASRNQLVGLHGDALKIKIKAPPEDGRANAELCEYVAGLIGIAKSRVQVISGHSARAKTLEIEGVTITQLSGSALLLQP